MPLGLGTTQFWYDSTRETREVFHEAAFYYGLNVIDTAEMYGNSNKEVGKILKQWSRENFYVIDKIMPDNMTEKGFMKSLRRSLNDLGTDYIDLYLLHWRENVDLNLLVEKMEQAKREGLIKEWGVSNFDVKDMEDLLKIKDGDKCYANEIMYNLFYRGVEYDLLPYLHEKGIKPISYSTLDTRTSRNRTAENKELRNICEKNGICLEALMLAFATRKYDLLAIFKTTTVEHLKENLKCLDFDIEPYMDIINEYYPAPTRKVPLEKR